MSANSKTIPTVEDVNATRGRLLKLTSRRLIQFVDARREALQLLAPPDVNGVRKPPDIAGAIAALESTRVLR